MINQQNVFNVILESHKAFLDYKKQKVEKVEKSGFFQRGLELVHGFGKKIWNFSMFLFFCKKQPAKCVWRYSRYSRK